jgi:hypothetical protein
LTSIRSAWKVRLAGWPPVRRAREGLPGALSHDGCGDAGREPLLAVLAEHPGELAPVVGVEDVGGRPARGRVHPHVQRRVLAVGEPALGDVELHRGDPEVEQDPVGVLEPEVTQRVGDPVERRVHGGEPVTEGREALAGQAQGLGVAVETDDAGETAPGEQGLAVPAQPQRRVDQDGTFVVEGGMQESDDPVEEHRDVGRRGHDAA